MLVHKKMSSLSFFKFEETLKSSSEEQSSMSFTEEEQSSMSLMEEEQSSMSLMEEESDLSIEEQTMIEDVGFTEDFFESIVSDEDTEGEDEEAMEYAQDLLNIPDDPDITEEETTEKIAAPEVIKIPDEIRPSFKIKNAVPEPIREDPPIFVIKPKIIPVVNKIPSEFPNTQIDLQKHIDLKLDGMKFTDKWKSLRKKMVIAMWNKTDNSVTLEELIVIASLIINKSFYGCEFSPFVEKIIKDL